MPEDFPVVDVSEWPVFVGETAGANEKTWLVDPDDSTSPTNRWLFKPITVHGDGSEQGGDWSEKLVGELALLLEIPAAEIQMATRKGIRGALSRNVRPSARWDLYNGGVWLSAETEIAYSSSERCPDNRGASVGHSLENLRTALTQVQSPPQSSGDMSTWNGMEVLCSYMFLDAIVANRDRHEQNWAILRPVLHGGTTAIAASFDHEGSLGYNLTDRKRSTLLEDKKAFATFVNKGTAWRFDWSSQPVPTLVEAAGTAARLVDSRIIRHLLALTDRIEDAAIAELTNRIPRMSEVTRTFCRELIIVNTERIRNEFSDIAP